MRLSMKSLPVCAPRRSKIIAAAALTSAAVTTILVLGQSGVTGAENQKRADASSFTVVGDGELPTKRPALGDSRAPLSSAETGYAISVASAAATIPRSATSVSGAAGPEVLSTDLPVLDVDDGGRVAQVVLYDYTDDKTYQQTVDLKTGSVVRSKSAARLQPPMSADETDAAVNVAVTAASIKPLRFAADFEKLAGVPLVSPKQIGYRAGTWIYGRTTAAGSECGLHRCAQLMISAPSGVYLDTRDFVVDLSAGSVIELRTTP